MMLPVGRSPIHPRRLAAAILLLSLGAPVHSFAGAPEACSPDVAGWFLVLLYFIALTSLSLLYDTFFGKRVAAARKVLSQSRRAPFAVGLCLLGASAFVFLTVQRSLPNAQGAVGIALLTLLLALQIRGVAALGIETGERIFMKAGSTLVDNGPACLMTGTLILGLASTFPVLGWLLGFWLACLAMGSTVISFRNSA